MPEMGLCNEEMLQFLSQSYEEECKKFIDLIPGKVSKGLMKARPDIVEEVFMQYMDCFVKKEWIGLANVSEVHTVLPLPYSECSADT